MCCGTVWRPDGGEKPPLMAGFAAGRRDGEGRRAMGCVCACVSRTTAAAAAVVGEKKEGKKGEMKGEGDGLEVGEDEGNLVI